MFVAVVVGLLISSDQVVMGSIPGPSTLFSREPAIVKVSAHTEKEKKNPKLCCFDLANRLSLAKRKVTVFELSILLCVPIQASLTLNCLFNHDNIFF